LAAVGIVAATKTVEIAIARGWSSSAVAATIEHFRSKPGAWSAGAIFHRIENVDPATPADQNWPTPAAGFERAVRVAASTATIDARRAADDAAARQRQADRADAAENERRFGATFDAIGDDERRAAAFEALGEQRAKILLGGAEGTAALLRAALLAAWAAADRDVDNRQRGPPA
jgi:hypothetical protein